MTENTTGTPRTFDGYFDRKRKERPRWNVEHEAKRAAPADRTTGEDSDGDNGANLVGPLNGEPK